ncbi:PX11C protein, partial [Regulus satrapa]|nr:PX11C protein [Regulus satrapa]
SASFPPCPAYARDATPGSVAMAAGALAGLVAALETHRGRDRAVSEGCAYGLGPEVRASAAPGAAPPGPGAPSAPCPMCRSPQGEDALLRGLSVLCNAANQLYYPCEHLAWAADVGIVRGGSQKWWARSTALWGCALLLGILRSLRILFQLRRKLSQHKCSTSSPQSQQKLRAQVRAEVLSILMDTADLSNAIHWLPPGFLWAGKFPPWLVGLLGTISSLIGIYQASRGANSEAA